MFVLFTSAQRLRLAIIIARGEHHVTYTLNAPWKLRTTKLNDHRDHNETFSFDLRAYLECWISLLLMTHDNVECSTWARDWIEWTAKKKNRKNLFSPLAAHTSDTKKCWTRGMQEIFTYIRRNRHQWRSINARLKWCNERKKTDTRARARGPLIEAINFYFN